MNMRDQVLTAALKDEERFIIELSPFIKTAFDNARLANTHVEVSVSTRLSEQTAETLKRLKWPLIVPSSS